MKHNLCILKLAAFVRNVQIYIYIYIYIYNIAVLIIICRFRINVVVKYAKPLSKLDLQRFARAAQKKGRNGTNKKSDIR